MSENSVTEIPRQLQDAQWAYTCEGLKLWELGEDGDHVIAMGHVDITRMASAVLTLSDDEWGDPLGEVFHAEIKHTMARIEGTPDSRADFVVHTGDDLDFPVTEWRLNRSLDSAEQGSEEPCPSNDRRAEGPCEHDAGHEGDHRDLYGHTWENAGSEVPDRG